MSHESNPSTQPNQWVMVGQLVGCHGVQGAFKLKTSDARPDWAEPAETLWIMPSNPKLRQAHPQGLSQSVEDCTISTDHKCLLQLAGITTRTAAEPWVGSEMWVPKTALTPVKDDDTYRTFELVGLAVRASSFATDGKVWGTVKAIVYATAQNFVEIALQPSQKTVVIPFETVFFPEVNVAQGWLVVADRLDAFLEEEAAIVIKPEKPKRPPRRKKPKPAEPTPLP
jgi:16S rRNA processing protein RimM